MNTKKMKSIIFSLFLLTLSNFIYAEQGAAIEGELVRLEFYEASGEYAVVYRQCESCKHEERRFITDARIELNNSPSSLKSIFEKRMQLMNTIDLAYSRETGKVLWFNGMEIESK